MFKNAEWIWHNDYQQKNIYLNFFENVEIQNKKGEYYINISADSKYALYINGVYVNGGQYADYPDYKVYDCLDVSSLLKEGHNEINVVAYCQNVDSSTYRKEFGAVIYELCGDDGILLSSGKNSIVALNSAYKSDGVDFVSGQLGYTFVYDVKKKDERIGLKSADILEKSKTLYPRPIKMLETLERQAGIITAQGVFKEDSVKRSGIGSRMQYSSMAFRNLNERKLPSKNGIHFNSEPGFDGAYAVIDFEKENTGIFDIEIDLPEDAEILIGYGEHLDDLRTRSWVGARNFCIGYHGKKGLNTFVNPFLRLGLRYMQIHVYAPSFTLYYAGFRPTLYPISDVPYFSCADNLHNKIYEVSKRTLWMCMHEHYEDCPWREQALYSMDSRNQMLCGYMALGEYDFAKSSIRLMALSIREDNMLELCSPARCSITIPSFSAIFPVQLYEYILYSGDMAFINEILPTATRIVDEFISRINKNGLIKCFQEAKYWNFYEWQDGLSGSISGEVLDNDVTYDAPLNAMVSMALNAVSKLYELLGEKQKSAFYCEKSKELNNSINNNFWDEDKKLYASFINKEEELFHYCELTNSLVVYCNACTEERLASVLYALASKTLIPVTISHSIFKYDALMRDEEKYSKYVFDDIANEWSKMLYNKATTFWETIQGADDFSYAGSLCHGWSAIPVYFYFKYACGQNIKPDASSEYFTKEAKSGIYECKGKILTPKGEIEF